MTEPTILTASVYFWRGGSTASTRRRNEERHLREVAAWLESECGMTITHQDLGSVTANTGAIQARFAYSESCANVYRSLSVTVAGERSNLTTLRRLADPATRRGTLARATRRANAKRVDQMLKASA